MTADLLRRAADLIEAAVLEVSVTGYHYAGVRQIGEEWAALLTPQVAAPLAAWLRAEAACMDSTADVTEHLPRILDSIEESMTGKPAHGHELRVSISTATEATALATAIVGEQP